MHKVQNSLTATDHQPTFACYVGRCWRIYSLVIFSLRIEPGAWSIVSSECNIRKGSDRSEWFITKLWANQVVVGVWVLRAKISKQPSPQGVTAQTSNIDKLYGVLMTLWGRITIGFILSFIIHSFIHRRFLVQDGPLASLSGFLWSHTYRPTVGLLWTSDQPVAEASTYTGQHNIQTSMPQTGFNPRPQQPSGRWDRLTIGWQSRMIGRFMNSDLERMWVRDLAFVWRDWVRQKNSG
jgi:hypothetical protein